MIMKTTMSVIVNVQNSHLLTLSLWTEKVFQVNSQNRPWPAANLPGVDFRSQLREYVTFEYVNFGFSFRLIVFFPF